MPRFIPRLLEQLRKRPAVPSTVDRPLRRAKRPKSLSTPRPPPFDWSAPRTHSAVLDPVNPLTTPRAYLPHKSLPPHVALPENALAQQPSVFNKPREMTDVERSWWANPYRQSKVSPLSERMLIMQQYGC